jgi:hypothetical protein
MTGELSGHELNRAIAEALGWAISFGPDCASRNVREWVFQDKFGHVFGKVSCGIEEDESWRMAQAYDIVPDWANDAEAALELCYQWTVEHDQGVMISPEEDENYRAVFMTKYREGWFDDISIGEHSGTTLAEALARLALAALKLGAVAEWQTRQT